MASRIPKFLVIGHRGNGMNALQSSDRRMRAIKENTITSFNTAAKYPLDFVEFDVQVSFSFWIFHLSLGGGGFLGIWFFLVGRNSVRLPRTALNLSVCGVRGQRSILAHVSF